MYIMLLKAYHFFFSAVVACTFNWPTVDLLPKQGWIIWLATSAFDCDGKLFDCGYSISLVIGIMEITMLKFMLDV